MESGEEVPDEWLDDILEKNEEAMIESLVDENDDRRYGRRFR